MNFPFSYYNFFPLAKENEGSHWNKFLEGFRMQIGMKMFPQGKKVTGIEDLVKCIFRKANKNGGLGSIRFFQTYKIRIALSVRISVDNEKRHHGLQG